MSVRNAVKLTLKNKAWVVLDSASTTVCGEAKHIIDFMQQAVDDDVVVSLCKQLGIYSTGFLFHNVTKGYTEFYRENVPPPTYRTQYLWDDGLPHWDLSKCLHWLFVHVRQIQYELRGDDLRAEDYFANLPTGSGIHDPYALKPEKGWRRDFGVHYCTVGEMVYAPFVWRFLSLARDNGWGNRSIGDIRLELDDHSLAFSPCIWQGKSVVDQYAESDNQTQGNARLFTRLWGERIGPQESWRKEWPALLLSLQDVRLQAAIRTSVVRFLRHGGFVRMNGMPDVNDDVVFNAVLQHSIPAFLDWLNDQATVSTVDEGLRILESYARLPILPFYFWNALNGTPICYGVIPIWTSQNHCISNPAGECRHLGLALTGLSPIAAWDWTSRGMGGLRVSRAEPRVLINVLRLMARPLVECRLYHPLWEQLDKDMRERIGGKIEEEWHKGK